MLIKWISTYFGKTFAPPLNNSSADVHAERMLYFRRLWIHVLPQTHPEDYVSVFVLSSKNLTKNQSTNLFVTYIYYKLVHWLFGGKNFFCLPERNSYPINMTLLSCNACRISVIFSAIEITFVGKKLCYFSLMFYVK